MFGEHCTIPALFEHDLLQDVYVLHRAAAAVAEMRAARFDPVLRGSEQFDDFGFVETASAAPALENDLFARQRMVHPGRPARDIGYAPSLVVEANNIGGLHGAGRQTAAHGCVPFVFQALRNSCRCGWPESASSFSSNVCSFASCAPSMRPLIISNCK
ncbi:hypothetical protein MnTg04_00819 [bacterium MnTg04]|nr:hypothetical protein MnTg04_00819 [bacterium MnTg04]